MHAPDGFAQLLQYLTIPVTEMFRDPEYYTAIREQVVPFLRTYPSLKLWVAGCSTGEEVYSMAIMLQEEGLLERSLIYATDINPESLEAARRGVMPLDRMRAYTENYQ
jgi:chemotaxis protein methyltransferase CheR